MNQYSMKISSGSLLASMPKITRSESWARTPGGKDGAWRDLQRIWVNEVLCWVLAPMQSFLILGSLLQWRWQWASIGHFVFLFSLEGFPKHKLMSTFPRKLSIPINSTKVRSCKTMLPAFSQDFKVKTILIFRELSNWYSLQDCLTKSTDAEICSCVQGETLNHCCLGLGHKKPQI